MFQFARFVMEDFIDSANFTMFVVSINDRYMVYNASRRRLTINDPIKADFKSPLDLLTNDNLALWTRTTRYRVRGESDGSDLGDGGGVGAIRKLFALAGRGFGGEEAAVGGGEDATADGIEEEGKEGKDGGGEEVGGAGARAIRRSAGVSSDGFGPRLDDGSAGGGVEDAGGAAVVWADRG